MYRGAICSALRLPSLRHPAFAKAVIGSGEWIQWGCGWIYLVSRLPQRGFVDLVSVYVLDPNLQPVAPPLISFENGELGIVGNYFVGLFSALSFDFPSHVRSPFLPSPRYADF